MTWLPVLGALAVAFGWSGVRWGLGLVGAGLDGGVDAGEVGEGGAGEVVGEGVLGLGPGVMDRAAVLPVARPVAQYAVLDGDGSLGCLDDVEEGDVSGRPGEAVAAFGSCTGIEESVSDESGEDDGEVLVGDLHFRSDLAGLAEFGVVLAGDGDHRSEGVVASFGEFELHAGWSLERC